MLGFGVVCRPTAFGQPDRESGSRISQLLMLQKAVPNPAIQPLLGVVHEEMLIQLVNTSIASWNWLTFMLPALDHPE